MCIFFRKYSCSFVSTVDYCLSDAICSFLFATSTISRTGTKVELATVEQWTKGEKASILQEATKGSTKAGKLPLIKVPFVPPEICFCQGHI